MASNSEFATDISTATYERATALMADTKAGTTADGSVRSWGFDGGGAASDRAKNYLRALLRQHAGHPDAEAIRALFNEMRISGDLIDRQSVACAIEALKKL